MKKILILTGILLAAAGAAQAQLAAGQWLLGGSAGYSSGRNEAGSPTPTYSIQTMRQLQLGPNVGYFVTDKLALGLGGGYVHYRSLNTLAATPGGVPEANATSTSNRYGLGPFARYYRMLTDKLGFYGQAEVRYGRNHTYSVVETPTGRSGSTTTLQGGSATLVPGAVFFIGSKVALEVSAGNVSASSMRGKTVPDGPGLGSSTNKEQSVTASFNLSQFRFGASVYLGQ